MHNLKLDTNLFSILTLYITEQIKKIKQNHVYFIKDHDKVNDIIKQLNIKEKIELFNLDFHHDLGYSPDPSLESLNCGNWVYKLILENKINSYTWLNTKDSKPPNIFPNCKYNVIDIIKNNYMLRELQDIDILIICLSPEWVPPYYQNLFYLWRDLTQNRYGESIDII